MNCEEIKHLLSQYVDGLLEPPQRAIVEKHLESCQECAGYYKQLLRLAKMADKLEIGGDESYWEKQKDSIISRIEKAEAAGVTPIPTKRRFGFYKVVAIAASVALVAFISIYESQNLAPVRNLFKPKKSEVRLPSPQVQPSVLEIGKAQRADTMPSQPVRETEKTSEETRKPVSDEKTVEKVMVLPPQETAAKPAAEMLPSSGTSKLSPAEAVKEEAAPSDAFQPQEPLEQLKQIVSPRPEISQAVKLVSKKKAVSDDLTKVMKITADKFEATSDADKGSTYVPKGNVALTTTPSTIKSAVKPTAGGEESFSFAPQPSDSSLFADFTDAELRQYSELHDRANELTATYGDFIGLPSRPARAVRSDVSGAAPADSLGPVIDEMAEAFYQLGVLTPVKNERESMLRNLESLKGRADLTTAQKIGRFIDELESLTK